MTRLELEAIRTRAIVAAQDYDRGDAASAYQRIRGDLAALIAEITFLRVRDASRRRT